jgi:tripartite-type tricarboxylate transporter receptor subunit TctC
MHCNQKDKFLLSKILLFIVLTLTVISGGVFAQPTPPTNIKIIIPFAPGGPTDVLGRLAAENLQNNLKATVITENRPGANGLVGVNFLKQGPVDGSNLLFVSSGMITFSPLMDKSTNFDPQKDLVPIICLAQTDIGLIIATGVNASNLKEYLSLAKTANPPFSLGSAGIGNILHAYIEILKDSSKIDFLHVPYKGATPSFADVLGGQISGMFISVSLAEQSIRAKKVKLIGVLGKRSALFPDVPTITEQGQPGLDMLPWFAIMGPKGMSPETVQLLASSIMGSNESDFRKKIYAAGSTPLLLTGTAFSDLIKNETNTWSKLIFDKKINFQ